MTDARIDASVDSAATPTLNAPPPQSWINGCECVPNVNQTNNARRGGCWDAAIGGIVDTGVQCTRRNYYFVHSPISSNFNTYTIFNLNETTTTTKGVQPAATVRGSTSLSAFVSPEECAPQIERWGEVRAMTAEEAAANLSGEELETYNGYYAEVREGVLKMQELAKIMMADVDKAKGQTPKTKGQRKRDKWAKVQAREAARAAAL